MSLNRNVLGTSFRLRALLGDLNAAVRRACQSRAASLLLLAAYFFIVAAATHSGYAGKYALSDRGNSPPNPGVSAASADKRPLSSGSIKELLDGTARKPWVYRQLLPQIANLADRNIPDTAKQRFARFVQSHFLDTRSVAPESFFAKVTLDLPAYHFRYMVVYYLSFLAIFASLFVLRRICLDLGLGRAEAILAPTAFMLAYPYLQTVGGYFYDYVELFFFSLLFLLAMRKQVVLLVAGAVIGTLNKESLFFFLPALYPILRIRASCAASALATGAGVLASGLTYLAVRYAFRDTPGGGGTVVHHLWDNLHNYLAFWRYHQLEATYGLIGPSGAFAGTLLLIALIAYRGWPGCPERVKQHLMIAAAINLPLFVAFCATGELRNLSFMFVGFVVVAGCAISRSLALAKAA